MKISSSFRPTQIKAAKKTMILIGDNLGSHYSIKQLAKASGTNAYTLKAVFRTVAGTSLYQYRIKHRMESAMEWLTNTEKLIGEIAIELGYGNPEYFSLRFRKTVGMSPSQYRMKFKK